MVYTYTPTYYTSLQDSITSICMNLLPFSFKKRRLPAIVAAEQQRSKQQSDNLKWQQESFHQMLNLMGLCKEGILSENEVSTFRRHLLETLIESPLDYEQPAILRDKFIFLQELFYAKCISEDEYHASKRPLLQRHAVQGAEIVGSQREASNEEWPVIDLKDEKCPVNQESLNPKKNPKGSSTTEQMRGLASVLGSVPPDEKLKNKNQVGRSTENPFWNLEFNEKSSEPMSMLVKETSPAALVMVQKGIADKGKKKPFRSVLLREQRDEEKETVKCGKKARGFDGCKKWKKNVFEDETAPLSLTEKSDGATYTGQLTANPIREGPDTKQIERKMHPDG